MQHNKPKIYNKKDNVSQGNVYKDEKDQWYNILNELKDYMFDCKNLRQFTKHNIDFVSLTEQTSNKPNIKIKNYPIQTKPSIISTPAMVKFESILAIAI